MLSSGSQVLYLKRKQAREKETVNIEGETP